MKNMKVVYEEPKTPNRKGNEDCIEMAIPSHFPMLYAVLEYVDISGHECKLILSYGSIS